MEKTLRGLWIGKALEWRNAASGQKCLRGDGQLQENWMWWRLQDGFESCGCLGGTFSIVWTRVIILKRVKFDHYTNVHSKDTSLRCTSNVNTDINLLIKSCLGLGRWFIGSGYVFTILMLEFL